MSARRWAAAAAAVLVVAAGGVIALSGAGSPPASARTLSVDTAKVERGALSALASGTGTLTYRARPDGSPYSVVNRAAGVFTELPAGGDAVGCGGVLYRVDDEPVVMLCGTIPTYRALHVGVRGRDVRQLNRNLRSLGYAADAHVRIAPGQTRFTAATQRAVSLLQRRKGMDDTGRLADDDVVFLPEPVRIAEVSGQIGEPARPGALVLSATSDRLHVQVSLDPSQQADVERGQRVAITLPGARSAAGPSRRVRTGRAVPGGPGDRAADATIPTFVSLDDPTEAGGLDRAPVDVDITTDGVADALSVPVTALVGSGSGYAVEVVRAGERRALVPVTLGLFDTGGGRVQVDGDLRAGDAVSVPST